MNIQLEPHVLTPYFYPLLTVSPLNCTEQEESNYNEYNLFCLKTRLRPFLEKHISSALTIEFVPLQRGPRFYIGIRLSDAGERIDLTSKQQRLLEDKVTEITTINRTTCLLFSADVELYLDQFKLIPVVWILSVLPYLPIDPTTNPYVNETHLFVDLDHYSDYNIRYDQMYYQIEKELRDYYRRGAVVCNAYFADIWHLSSYILLGFSSILNEAELLEDEAIAELTDSNGLYLPTWHDVRFAPDRVEFLLSRMAGERIVKIKIHPIQKANVAKILSGRDFLINERHVILYDVQDLDEIKDLMSYISTSPNENKAITLISEPISEPLPLGVSSWEELSGESYLAASF